MNLSIPPIDRRKIKTQFSLTIKIKGFKITIICDPSHRNRQFAGKGRLHNNNVRSREEEKKAM